jgi:hypothetical protein
MTNGEKKTSPSPENHPEDRGFPFFSNRGIELLCGCLMILGIILAFFYRHLGGLLVGLSFGIYFFRDILRNFLYAKEVYTEHGLVTTLMLIGTIIYFLITLPAFIIFTLIGFGIVYFIRYFTAKK